eukprot:jgi/Antlo1/2474/1630
MEEKYDFVVLGTGMAECALSWAHSSKGRKVLQIDRHAAYGSDMRTLRYSELEHSAGSGKPDVELMGLDRFFCIDITPKLMLADGKVRELLERLGIFEVVDFVAVPGSFIYKHGKVYTVPSCERDAIKSGVIGILQKPRVVNFFWDVKKYCRMSKDEREKVNVPGTMREYFCKHGLGRDAQEFIGHAVALNLDDSYLDKAPHETLENIHLFARSLLALEGSSRSPYIYPLYGISEISQAFSRKAAINGAVFRLNTPVLDIERDGEEFVVWIHDPIENRRVTVRTKCLLGEPSYFIENVRAVCRVIRCICIVKGDIELIKGTPSAQIIFLASELKRRNDIFLLVLGERECSAPRGFKIATISTVLEGEDPVEETKFVMERLGNVVKVFTTVRHIYEPDSCPKNAFISKTIDQSTHFESLYADIIRLARETGVEDVFLQTPHGACTGPTHKE